MSRRRGRQHLRQTTDPRTVPGTIVGPGFDDSHSTYSVVVDTSNAVLLDGVAAAVAHVTSMGEPTDAVALTLAGRVNRTTDRAEVLYLTDLHGAASLVADVIGLSRRMGKAAEFDRLLQGALAKVPR